MGKEIKDAVDKLIEGKLVEASNEGRLRHMISLGLRANKLSDANIESIYDIMIEHEMAILQDDPEEYAISALLNMSKRDFFEYVEEMAEMIGDLE